MNGAIAAFAAILALHTAGATALPYVYTEPVDGPIRAIAPSVDGSLVWYVSTGNPASLVQWDALSKKPKARLLFENEQTLTALAVSERAFSTKVYVGTEAGLVIEVDSGPTTLSRARTIDFSLYLSKPSVRFLCTSSVHPDQMTVALSADIFPKSNQSFSDAIVFPVLLSSFAPFFASNQTLEAAEVTMAFQVEPVGQTVVSGTLLGFRYLDGTFPSDVRYFAADADTDSSKPVQMLYDDEGSAVAVTYGPGGGSLFVATDSDAPVLLQLGLEALDRQAAARGPPKSGGALGIVYFPPQPYLAMLCRDLRTGFFGFEAVESPAALKAVGILSGNLWHLPGGPSSMAYSLSAGSIFVGTFSTPSFLVKLRYNYATDYAYTSVVAESGRGSLASVSYGRHIYYSTMYGYILKVDAETSTLVDSQFQSHIEFIGTAYSLCGVVNRKTGMSLWGYYTHPIKISFLDLASDKMENVALFEMAEGNAQFSYPVLGVMDESDGDLGTAYFLTKGSPTQPSVLAQVDVEGMTITYGIVFRANEHSPRAMAANAAFTSIYVGFESTASVVEVRLVKTPGSPTVFTGRGTFVFTVPTSPFYGGGPGNYPTSIIVSDQDKTLVIGTLYSALHKVRTTDVVNLYNLDFRRFVKSYSIGISRMAHVDQGVSPDIILTMGDPWQVTPGEVRSCAILRMDVLSPPGLSLKRVKLIPNCEGDIRAVTVFKKSSEASNASSYTVWVGEYKEPARIYPLQASFLAPFVPAPTSALQPGRWTLNNGVLSPMSTFRAPIGSFRTGFLHGGLVIFLGGNLYGQSSSVAGFRASDGSFVGASKYSSFSLFDVTAFDAFGEDIITERAVLAAPTSLSRFSLRSMSQVGISATNVSASSDLFPERHGLVSFLEVTADGRYVITGFGNAKPWPVAWRVHRANLTLDSFIELPGFSAFGFKVIAQDPCTSEIILAAAINNTLPLRGALLRVSYGGPSMALTGSFPLEPLDGLATSGVLDAGSVLCTPTAAARYAFVATGYFASAATASVRVLKVELASFTVVGRSTNLLSELSAPAEVFALIPARGRLLAVSSAGPATILSLDPETLLRLAQQPPFPIDDYSEETYVASVYSEKDGSIFFASSTTSALVVRVKVLPDGQLRFAGAGSELSPSSAAVRLPTAASEGYLRAGVIHIHPKDKQLYAVFATHSDPPRALRVRLTDMQVTDKVELSTAYARAGFAAVAPWDPDLAVFIPSTPQPGNLDAAFYVSLSGDVLSVPEAFAVGERWQYGTEAGFLYPTEDWPSIHAFAVDKTSPASDGRPLGAFFSRTFGASASARNASKVWTSLHFRRPVALQCIDRFGYYTPAADLATAEDLPGPLTVLVVAPFTGSSVVFAGSDTVPARIFELAPCPASHVTRFSPQLEERFGPLASGLYVLAHPSNTFTSQGDRLLLGSGSSPGFILSVNTSTLEVAESVQLPWGDDGARFAALHPLMRVAFFATVSQPPAVFMVSTFPSLEILWRLELNKAKAPLAAMLFEPNLARFIVTTTDGAPSLIQRLTAPSSVPMLTSAHAPQLLTPLPDLTASLPGSAGVYSVYADEGVLNVRGALLGHFRNTSLLGVAITVTTLLVRDSPSFDGRDGQSDGLWVPASSSFVPFNRFDCSVLECSDSDEASFLDSCNCKLPPASAFMPPHVLTDLEAHRGNRLVVAMVNVEATLRPGQLTTPPLPVALVYGTPAVFAVDPPVIATHEYPIALKLATSKGFSRDTDKVVFRRVGSLPGDTSTIPCDVSRYGVLWDGQIVLCFPPPRNANHLGSKFVVQLWRSGTTWLTSRASIAFAYPVFGAIEPAFGLAPSGNASHDAGSSQGAVGPASSLLLLYSSAYLPEGTVSLDVKVWVGSSRCRNVKSSIYSPGLASCEAPPGIGLNVPVTAEVSYRTLSPTAGTSYSGSFNITSREIVPAGQPYSFFKGDGLFEFSAGSLQEGTFRTTVGGVTVAARTVVDYALPSIARMEPSRWPARGGALTVVVSGSDFPPESARAVTVTLGDQLACSPSFTASAVVGATTDLSCVFSEDRLRSVTSSHGITSLPLRLLYQMPGWPAFTATQWPPTGSSPPFSLFLVGAPFIAAIEPSSGPASTRITIRGSAFLPPSRQGTVDDAVQVAVGGVPCLDVAVDSDAAVKCTVPHFDSSAMILLSLSSSSARVAVVVTTYLGSSRAASEQTGWFDYPQELVIGWSPLASSFAFPLLDVGTSIPAVAYSRLSANLPALGPLSPPLAISVGLGAAAQCDAAVEGAVVTDGSSTKLYVGPAVVLTGTTRVFVTQGSANVTFADVSLAFAAAPSSASLGLDRAHGGVLVGLRVSCLDSRGSLASTGVARGWRLDYPRAAWAQSTAEALAIASARGFPPSRSPLAFVKVAVAFPFPFSSSFVADDPSGTSLGRYLPCSARLVLASSQAVLEETREASYALSASQLALPLLAGGEIEDKAGTSHLRNVTITFPRLTLANAPLASKLQLSMACQWAPPAASALLTLTTELPALTMAVPALSPRYEPLSSRPALVITSQEPLTPPPTVVIRSDLPLDSSQLATCTMVSRPSKVANETTNAVADNKGFVPTSQEVSGLLTSPFVFDRFFVIGRRGNRYLISVTCTVGTAVLEPLEVEVQVAGCPPGKEPSASGSSCTDCSGDSFSLGGSSPCQNCPMGGGASCVGGILQLLPGYYRPPSQADTPISGSTELHPCFNDEACTLDVTSLSSLVASNSSYNASFLNALVAIEYGCQKPAYGGPLCGVCQPGFSLSGQACSQCWSRGAAVALLFVLVALLLSAAAWLGVYHRPGSKSPAAITFKQLLGYLQMLSLIAAFRIDAVTLVRKALGWTDIGNVSLLSFGPLGCLVALPFLSKFLLTIALPILFALAVVAVSAGRHLLVEGRDRLPAIAASVKTPRASVAAALGFAGSVAPVSSVPVRRGSILHATQEEEGSAGIAGAGKAATKTAPGKASRWSVVGSANSAAVPEPFSDAHLSQIQRLVSASLLLLSLFYMPILSTCFKALDCLDRPVDGVTYLRADLRVICGAGEHLAARVIAPFVLVLLGLGFPALIIAKAHKLRRQFLLADNSDSAAGRRPMAPVPAATAAALAVWRPLFDGYDAPKGTLWWEAVVLLRKAILALIAAFAGSGPAGLTLFACVLLLSSTVHEAAQPYKGAGGFNTAERVGLASAAMTALLALMFPTASTTASSAVLSSNFEPSRAILSVQSAGVTTAIILLLVGTLAFFLARLLDSLPQPVLQVCFRHRAAFARATCGCCQVRESPGSRDLQLAWFRLSAGSQLIKSPSNAPSPSSKASRAQALSGDRVAHTFNPLRTEEREAGRRSFASAPVSTASPSLVSLVCVTMVGIACTLPGASSQSPPFTNNGTVDDLPSLRQFHNMQSSIWSSADVVEGVITAMAYDEVGSVLWYAAKSDLAPTLIRFDVNAWRQTGRSIASANYGVLTCLALQPLKNDTQGSTLYSPFTVDNSYSVYGGSLYTSTADATYSQAQHYVYSGSTSGKIGRYNSKTFQQIMLVAHPADSSVVSLAIDVDAAVLFAAYQAPPSSNGAFQSKVVGIRIPDLFPIPGLEYDIPLAIGQATMMIMSATAISTGYRVLLIGTDANALTPQNGSAPVTPKGYLFRLRATDLSLIGKEWQLLPHQSPPTAATHHPFGQSAFIAGGYVSPFYSASATRTAAVYRASFRDDFSQGPTTSGTLPIGVGNVSAVVVVAGHVNAMILCDTHPSRLYTIDWRSMVDVDAGDYFASNIAGTKLGTMLGIKGQFIIAGSATFPGSLLQLSVGGVRLVGYRPFTAVSGPGAPLLSAIHFRGNIFVSSAAGTIAKITTSNHALSDVQSFPQSDARLELSSPIVDPTTGLSFWVSNRQAVVPGENPNTVTIYLIQLPQLRYIHSFRMAFPYVNFKCGLFDPIGGSAYFVADIRPNPLILQLAWPSGKVQTGINMTNQVTSPVSSAIDPNHGFAFVAFDANPTIAMIRLGSHVASLYYFMGISIPRSRGLPRQLVVSPKGFLIVLTDIFAVMKINPYDGPSLVSSLRYDVQPGPGLGPTAVSLLPGSARAFGLFGMRGEDGSPVCGLAEITLEAPSDPLGDLSGSPIFVYAGCEPPVTALAAALTSDANGDTYYAWFGTSREPSVLFAGTTDTRANLAGNCPWTTLRLPQARYKAAMAYTTEGHTQMLFFGGSNSLSTETGGSMFALNSDDFSTDGRLMFARSVVTGRDNTVFGSAGPVSADNSPMLIPSAEGNATVLGAAYLALTSPTRVARAAFARFEVTPEHVSAAFPAEHGTIGFISVDEAAEYVYVGMEPTTGSSVPTSGIVWRLQRQNLALDLYLELSSTPVTQATKAGINFGALMPRSGYLFVAPYPVTFDWGVAYDYSIYRLQMRTTPPSVSSLSTAPYGLATAADIMSSRYPGTVFFATTLPGATSSSPSSIFIIRINIESLVIEAATPALRPLTSYSKLLFGMPAYNRLLVVSATAPATAAIVNPVTMTLESHLSIPSAIAAVKAAGAFVVTNIDDATVFTAGRLLSDKNVVFLASESSVPAASVVRIFLRPNPPLSSLPVALEWGGERILPPAVGEGYAKAGVIHLYQSDPAVGVEPHVLYTTYYDPPKVFRLRLRDLSRVSTLVLPAWAGRSAYASLYQQTARLVTNVTSPATGIRLVDVDVLMVWMDSVFPGSIDQSFTVSTGAVWNLDGTPVNRISSGSRFMSGFLSYGQKDVYKGTALAASEVWPTITAYGQDAITGRVWVGMQHGLSSVGWVLASKAPEFHQGVRTLCADGSPGPAPVKPVLRTDNGSLALILILPSGSTLFPNYTNPRIIQHTTFKADPPAGSPEAQARAEVERLDPAKAFTIIKSNPAVLSLMHPCFHQLLDATVLPAKYGRITTGATVPAQLLGQKDPLLLLGSASTPAYVIAVDALDIRRIISSEAIEDAVDGLQHVVLHPETSCAFFASGSYPGAVMQVALSASGQIIPLGYRVPLGLNGPFGSLLFAPALSRYIVTSTLASPTEVNRLLAPAAKPVIRNVSTFALDGTLQSRTDAHFFAIPDEALGGASQFADGLPTIFEPSSFLQVDGDLFGSFGNASMMAVTMTLASVLRLDMWTDETVNTVTNWEPVDVSAFPSSFPCTMDRCNDADACLCVPPGKQQFFPQSLLDEMAHPVKRRRFVVAAVFSVQAVLQPRDRRSNAYPLVIIYNGPVIMKFNPLVVSQHRAKIGIAMATPFPFNMGRHAMRLRPFAESLDSIASAGAVASSTAESAAEYVPCLTQTITDEGQTVLCALPLLDERLVGRRFVIELTGLDEDLSTRRVLATSVATVQFARPVLSLVEPHTGLLTTGTGGEADRIFLQSAALVATYSDSIIELPPVFFALRVTLGGAANTRCTAPAFVVASTGLISCKPPAGVGADIFITVEATYPCLQPSQEQGIPSPLCGFNVTSREVVPTGQPYSSYGTDGRYSYSTGSLLDGSMASAGATASASGAKTTVSFVIPSVAGLTPAVWPVKEGGGGGGDASLRISGIDMPPSEANAITVTLGSRLNCTPMSYSVLAREANLTCAFDASALFAAAAPNGITVLPLRLMYKMPNWPAFTATQWPPIGSPSPFSLSLVAAPLVTSVEPSSGPAFTRITVRGSAFLPPTAGAVSTLPLSVLVGGIPCSAVSVESDSIVRCMVPRFDSKVMPLLSSSSSSARVAIAVTTSLGPSRATSEQTGWFDYPQELVIDWHSSASSAPAFSGTGGTDTAIPSVQYHLLPANLPAIAPLSPPLAIRVVLGSAAQCEAQLEGAVITDDRQTTSPYTRSPIVLTGTTRLFVAEGTANVTFAGLGLAFASSDSTASLGLDGSPAGVLVGLRVSCLDSRGSRATTDTTRGWRLDYPSLKWSTTASEALTSQPAFVPSEAPLSWARADVAFPSSAEGTFTPDALSTAAALARTFPCSAQLFSSAGAGLGGERLIGEAVDASYAVASSDTNASITFPRLTLAKAPLGVEILVRAVCRWSPPSASGSVALTTTLPQLRLRTPSLGASYEPASSRPSATINSQEPLTPPPTVVIRSSLGLQGAQLATCTMSALPANAANDTATAGINSNLKGFVPTSQEVTGFSSAPFVFDRFFVIGRRGSRYLVSVACTVGSAKLAPLEVEVQVAGCPPGKEPSASGSSCTDCSGDSFSLGGSSPCSRCPVGGGASCVGGILQLLPGYYRPPSQADTPISGSTELHPCFNDEACTLNVTVSGANLQSLGAASNTSAFIEYGCQKPAYGGPLCGVCQPGFAMFGQGCAPCWPQVGAIALLFVLVAMLVSAAAWLGVYHKPGSKSPAAITFKQLLGYLQMLSLIAAFRIDAIAQVRKALGWTDVGNVSLISFGPLGCLVTLPFLGKFLLTILLPVLFALLVLAVSAGHYLWLRAKEQAPVVQAAIRAQRASFAVALGQRSPVMAAIVGSPRLRGNGAISPVLTAASASAPPDLAPLELTPAATTASTAAPTVHLLPSERLLSASLLLLSLFYMPILSACFKALDCLDRPVDGVTYLRADLRIVCGQGGHFIARIVAPIVLVLLGLGFPFVIIFKARQLRQQFLLFESTNSNNDKGTFAPVLTAAVAVWKPLFDGYDARKGTLWWEAVVLLRKAILALIAALAGSGPTGLTLFVFVLVFALTLHESANPYAGMGGFNSAERAALLSAAVIGLLALMYPASATSGGTAATDQAVSQAAMNAQSAGISAAIILILIATLGYLLSRLFNSSWQPLLALAFRRRGLIRKATCGCCDIRSRAPSFSSFTSSSTSSPGASASLPELELAVFGRSLSTRSLKSMSFRSSVRSLRSFSSKRSNVSRQASGKQPKEFLSHEKSMQRVGPRMSVVPMVIARQRGSPPASSHGRDDASSSMSVVNPLAAASRGIGMTPSDSASASGSSPANPPALLMRKRVEVILSSKIGPTAGAGNGNGNVAGVATSLSTYNEMPGNRALMATRALRASFAPRANNPYHHQPVASPATEDDSPSGSLEAPTAKE